MEEDSSPRIEIFRKIYAKRSREREMDYETKSCSKPFSQPVSFQRINRNFATREEIRGRSSTTIDNLRGDRALDVKREEGVSGERKKGKKKKRVRYLSKEEERSEKESSEWKVITQRNRKGMMIYTDYRYILKRRNCESINGKERNFVT